MAYIRLQYIFQDGVQQIVLLHNGETIDAAQISAVWYRKLWKLQVPADLDPAYQDIFLKEYQTYLQLFFQPVRPCALDE